jgi:rhomboid protease GluP
MLSLRGSTEDGSFMLQHGAMYEKYIIEGKEYDRLIRSMFLHFGLQHLLYNMIMLGALGANLEPVLGRIRFVSIYLISGIAGNLASLAYHHITQQTVVSAGASGAIFGLMGAYVWMTVRFQTSNAIYLGKGALLLIAMGLFYGLGTQGIDHAAHIGGFVCGLLLAIVLFRKSDMYRLEFLDR